jgi:hypothetical protein
MQPGLCKAYATALSPLKRDVAGQAAERDAAKICKFLPD